MKKRYAVTLQEGEVTLLEVDGKRYSSVDQIEDEDDKVKMATIVSDLTDFPDFDVERKGTKKPGTKDFPFEFIILGAFSLVALIMLTIAAISGYTAYRGFTREISAPGRVIEISEYTDSQGETTFYPVVSFPLLDASIYTAELNEGSSPSNFEAGDEVTVLYDPNFPERARIRGSGSVLGPLILPGITGFLGLSFLVAVGFTLYVLRKTT